MPKVNAKVIETLAVMAKYNPFFEKAGMMRVDYRRDETSVEKKIRSLLESCNFDFDLIRSKAYCRDFFNRLVEQDKKLMLEYLSEFARQPFIKIEAVSPELLAKTFPSDCAYFYWVNIDKMR